MLRNSINIMVDCETTALNASEGRITSLVAVPFEIDNDLKLLSWDFTDRFISIIHDDEFEMFQNPDTMAYREANKIREMELVLADQQSAADDGLDYYTQCAQRFDDYIKYLRMTYAESTIWLWAKPSHFDMSFITDMFYASERKFPISHRNIMCLMTFIETVGLIPGQTMADFYKDHPMVQPAHNPVNDAVHQIYLLEIALNYYRERLSSAFK